MSLLKTIWNVLFKKNLVNQDFIPQEIIKEFAQKLDDAVRFDKIFKGKLAFLEKYDAWVFEQIITAFLSLFGKKLSPKIMNLFSVSMVGFNSGNLVQVQKTTSELLTEVINLKKVNDDIESIVIASQVGMIFGVVNLYVSKQPA